MKTYRVVCTGGHVYYVDAWLAHDTWTARMSGETPLSGEDERAAVVNACNAHISIAEVRAPGELTTSEQVAAERERCAVICDDLAREDANYYECQAGAAGCANAIRVTEARRG